MSQASGGSPAWLLWLSVVTICSNVLGTSAGSAGVVTMVTRTVSLSIVTNTLIATRFYTVKQMTVFVLINQI